MYLAKIINEVLDSKKDRFTKGVSYQTAVNTLNRAFRDKESFKFRYELYKDYARSDFSVSGLYDMEKNTKYIILNFPKNNKTIRFNDTTWKDFKFAVSQVCQHEAIHELQWQHRNGVKRERTPLIFRNHSCTLEEEQNYLLDVDEVDAYAHDIAMEIKFFYPTKNPYSVLRKVGRHKKIWSYHFYRKTFKGTDWSPVRNRLLKKAYQWMPYVTV